MTHAGINKITTTPVSTGKLPLCLCVVTVYYPEKSFSNYSLRQHSDDDIFQDTHDSNQVTILPMRVVYKALIAECFNLKRKKQTSFLYLLNEKIQHPYITCQ